MGTGTLMCGAGIGKINSALDYGSPGAGAIGKLGRKKLL
jgi:hypothetical protein